MPKAETTHSTSTPPPQEVIADIDLPADIFFHGIDPAGAYALRVQGNGPLPGRH